MDIFTFNYHYRNILLEKLSKGANKTVGPQRDFNIGFLVFESLDHVNTFLDDLTFDSLQLQAPLHFI